MKTQGQNVLDEGEQAISDTGRRRRSRWLAGASALLVATLLIAGSVAVFGWRAGTNSLTTRNAASVGQWVAVLNGYRISQLVTVRSDLSVLYACATKARPSDSVSSNGQPESYTILRSSDAGTHWQDVGTQAAPVGTCQIAANPGNSNEIYIVTQQRTNNGTFIHVLKHSADAGRSWTTAIPTIKRPGLQTVPVWQIERLSMVGDHLFGLQALPNNALPPAKKGEVIPDVLLPIMHLFESADGGKTWTIVTGTIGTANQSVLDYAISPLDPQILYVIVAPSWSRMLPAQPDAKLPPSLGGKEGLYKSIDGGKTWQIVLKDVNYSSRVQLASDRPQVIYVGGIFGPQPLIGAPERTFDQEKAATVYPPRYGGLVLHMSGDGGIRWHDIAAPSPYTTIYNWQVSSDGQVYSVAGPEQRSDGQGSGSAGAATSSPDRPSDIPPQQSGTPPQRGAVVGGKPGSTGGNGTAAATPITITPASSTPARTEQRGQVQRYNPATGKWSYLTTLPEATYGTLLATTLAAGGRTMLWVLISHGEKTSLYRYMV